MNALQQHVLLNQQQQQQQASNTTGNTKKTSKKKGPPLRRGKWTPEEEAYAGRLIQEFKAGLLPLTDGTTLRTFLSKLLNCDPMRISKKFVGSNCIGKQVFRRRTADLNRLSPEQIQQSRQELSELERRFLDRVAQTNRVKSSGVGATTAAAGAATGAAVPSNDNHVLDGNPQFLPFGGGNHNNNNNANLNNTMGFSMNMGGGNHNNLNNLNNNHTMNGYHPPSPPWLRPPLGYKQGQGASMAAGNTNNRAAAAGRALLGGGVFGSHHHHPNDRDNNNNNNGNSHSASGLLQALQQRASQSSSMSNLFASQGSMAQLAAARGGKYRYPDCHCICVALLYYSTLFFSDLTLSYCLVSCTTIRFGREQQSQYFH